MALRELLISLPQKSNGEYIVASKCQAADVGLGTVIRLDNGINAFAVVNSRIVNLMDGRTLEDSYFSVTNRRMGILEKRNARIAVYGYRGSVSGCSVGISMTAKDAADGTEKSLGGYWEYTLEIVDYSKLIELADAGNGVVLLDNCIRVMNTKGRIRDITESVIMKVLETTPFNKLRGKLSDVSEAVIEKFLNSGSDINTGFKLTSFSFSDMRITSNEEIDNDSSEKRESYKKTSAGESSDRFGGALKGYGIGLGQIMGNTSKNASSNSLKANELCDTVSAVEKATAEVICKTARKTVSGSAFLISEGKDIYIVTNFHVVEEALEDNGVIAIRLSKKVDPDNCRLLATILSVDPVNDLAILESQFDLPENIACLKLADMSSLSNGQTVISVGSPSEFSFNAVLGDIANTTVNLRGPRMSCVLCNLIAPQKNSNGAVVRVSDGKVIGISTAIKKPEHMQNHVICASADAIRNIIHKTEK